MTVVANILSWSAWGRCSSGPAILIREGESQWLFEGRVRARLGCCCIGGMDSGDGRRCISCGRRYELHECVACALASTPLSNPVVKFTVTDPAGVNTSSLIMKVDGVKVAGRWSGLPCAISLHHSRTGPIGFRSPS